MSMVLNDSKFNAQLQAFADALNIDPALLIKDEMRKFLKTAINITPPKTKEAGERTIAKDAGSVFTPLNDSFLRYEFDGGFIGNADKWFTAKSGAVIHAQFAHVDVNGRGMKRYYAARRDPRSGRPLPGQSGRKSGNHSWQVDYAVGYEAFAAFLKIKKALIGLMKSGFLKAYKEVGGELPAWIERHYARSAGGVVNNLHNKKSPSMSVSNHAPGILNQERIIAAAFRIRTGAIKTRMKGMVGGWAKDVKSKTKVKSNITQTY